MDNTLSIQDRNTKQLFEVFKNKEEVITIREISNGQISSIAISKSLANTLVDFIQKVEVETDYAAERREVIDPLNYSFTDEIELTRKYRQL